jgi:hypothetical protein
MQVIIGRNILMHALHVITYSLYASGAYKGRSLFEGEY